MEEQVQVCIDASRKEGKLEHRWNYIGYDECKYTHSPGGTALIWKIGSLEKPYFIRTHHLLCTGIRHGFYKWGSTNIYTEDRDGRPVYDYDTLDRIIDTWLMNNCIPFLELGFMPKDLADPREAENGAEGGVFDDFEFMLTKPSWLLWIPDAASGTGGTAAEICNTLGFYPYLGTFVPQLILLVITVVTFVVVMKKNKQIRLEKEAAAQQ